MIELLKLSENISKYCVGMEGNVSAKIDSKIVIKASGAKLNKLKHDDLVSFNFNGDQLDNFDRKGSMELGFHLSLLKQDGINFISHTHPSNTLKILCSDYSQLFSDKRLFPDQVVFNNKKSCLVPYSKPGDNLNETIKQNVNNFILKNNFFPNLILLKNHGIIACGKSIDECIIITDICEKAAEIFLGTIMIGDTTFLTDEQINELITDNKEIYRKQLL
jgi:L-fuculose-phosphate aldolase